MEHIRKIWGLATDKSLIMTTQRAAHVLSELFSDMRKYVRSLSESSSTFDAAMHIEEWGRVVAFMIFRAKKDTEWELGYVAKQGTELDEKRREGYETRIAELEQRLDEQETKYRAETEELRLQLRAILRERNQLNDELHYKLQEMCTIPMMSIW